MREYITLNVFGIPVHVDLNGGRYWVDDRLVSNDGGTGTAIRGMISEYLKYTYLSRALLFSPVYSMFPTDMFAQTPDSDGWRFF